MSKAGLTPMMKQYYEIKSNYDDCILFFRLGDFYEMFGDDAVQASAILDITLTSRSKGENGLPMCGIPYHSAESYIAKLNQKGKKVAVCEQVSDPKAKGIVDRAVKRVLTPSTNTSDLNLEAKENQFLIVLDGTSENLHSCIIDISTGEIFLRKLDGINDIQNIVSTYRAKEIVIEKTLYKTPAIYEALRFSNDILISSYECSESDKNSIVTEWRNLLTIHKDNHSVEAALLGGAYLREVIGYEIEAIQKIVNISDSRDNFELDKSSTINLEIFFTLMDGSRKDSLVNKIDYTLTSMGGRMLRSWLIRPLKNIDKIQIRQDYVSDILSLNNTVQLELNEKLKSIYDIDRLLSRVNTGMASPRDLIAMKGSIMAALELKEIDISNGLSALIKNIPEAGDALRVLNKLKDEDVKITTREGGIFKAHLNEELDNLNNLLTNGKNYLLEIQKTEAEKNGISTLKLGFNKVFGYYLEVSKGKVSSVPDYFIRKQTLTNSERYITPELKEYEEKVLTAQDKVREIEYNMFVDLLEELKVYRDTISQIGYKVGQLDCYNCLALLAKAQGYVKPYMVEDRVIEVENGRHPVIEEIIGKYNYIPNNCNFNEELNVQVITGPNMGGKSTYLRQVALICLLAQIGSFVPADKAKLGCVDQIYSRVGATDNLSKGQSTFMVEMSETAYILAHATDRSLIIMDEVGRGTSTSDGLSLAMSITDYLNTNIKARTLFATHYHELINHGDKIEGVKNYSIAVTHDENGKPVFLHKIVEGGINKSYGIEVAESAGVPAEIIENSKRYLNEYNTQNDRKSQSLDSYSQDSLFVEKASKNSDELNEILKAVDLNRTTPLESMQILNDLVQKLS